MPESEGVEAVVRSRVKRSDPEPYPLTGTNLIAHQADQWRDDHRDTNPLMTQHGRADEVNGRLAPPRPLHEQDFFATVHECVDDFLLVIAKLGGFIANASPQE